MDAVIPVLYEDNHLLVVEKPENIPVQADVSGDDDVLSILKRYIKETYHKPGEVYLGLVHRLDRPVGGVMVFARTSKAAARLTEQFKTHAAKKRYAAVVTGAPAPEAELTDWLEKDERTFSSRAVPEGTPGAKEARLRYALLSEADGRALLDVELYTGRPHQIRVQLAHAGLPLEGDQRYNANAAPGEQIRLWAYALTLRHPTLAEEMTFFSAPRGGGFAAFPAAVKLLPAFAACRGVHEDGELLVVDKNAGVEVETDLVPELLSIYPEIYAVHRLDANTRGLVALARTPEKKAALERAFHDHDLTKVYHAVVCGAPPERGRLVHWGVKDAARALMQIVPEGTQGAVRMALSYRVLTQAADRALVEIDLETGRTHQIRAQFAAAGYPVLGDDRYGDRAMNKRCHRRAQELLAKTLVIDGRTFTSLRELSL